MTAEIKAALKSLRAENKDRVARVARVVKGQKADLVAIKKAIEAGGAEGLSVPDIAAATGLGPEQVLWYVSAMRKYGQAAEGAAEDGYFRYTLTGAVTPSDDAGRGDPGSDE